MSQQFAARLEATVTVPDHVVFRSFAQETVVLNLETGLYHGLNVAAGEMLRELKAAGLVRTALARLAETFPAAGDRLEQDLLAFCDEAHQRGLIDMAA